MANRTWQNRHGVVLFFVCGALGGLFAPLLSGIQASELYNLNATPIFESANGQNSHTHITVQDLKNRAAKNQAPQAKKPATDVLITQAPGRRSPEVCQQAVEAIDRHLKKTDRELGDTYEKIRREVMNLADRAIWRPDIASEYTQYVDAINEKRQKTKVIAAMFPKSPGVGTRKWLEFTRQAIVNQASPEYRWSYYNKQFEEAVRELSTREEQTALKERFRNRWDARQPQNFSDSFLDLADSLGVTQLNLTDAQKSAVTDYFQKRTDLIGTTAEMFINPHIRLTADRVENLLKMIGIGEEAFSKFVAQEMPSLKGYWENKTPEARNFVSLFVDKYRYAPFSPIAGVAFHFFVEQILSNPSAILIPSALQGNPHSYLLALPEYQMLLVYKPDGTLEWAVPVVLDEQEVRSMLPRPKIERIKEAPKPVVSSQPSSGSTNSNSISGTILNNKENESAPSAFVELDAPKLQELRASVQLRLAELNRTVPGYHRILEDHLVPILRMMPWLQRDAEWPKFEKGLTLLLKAKFSTEEGLVDGLLRLATEFEERYLREVRERAIQEQVALSAAQKPVQSKPVITFDRPEEIKPSQVKYNEGPRSYLRALVRRDLPAAYTELAVKYGPKFTDIKPALNLPEQQQRTTLNLFIDWMTYQGAPFNEFAASYPLFTEVVKRESNRPMHAFHFWAYIRYLNQQEVKIGANDGTPTFVFDSSIVGATEWGTHPHSVPSVREKIERAARLSKTRTEISPTVATEMATALVVYPRELLRDLYISNRMAGPIVNGELVERLDLAAALSRMGVGQVPESPELMTSDSKIVADVAIMAEKSKNPYWFVTKDANLFLPFHKVVQNGGSWRSLEWDIRVELDRHIQIDDNLVPVYDVRIKGPIKSHFRIVHPTWEYRR